MLLAEATRLPLLIFRRPRFHYRSNESEKKAAILPFDTVSQMQLPPAVDTIFAWRSPIEKMKRAKRADFCACIFHKKVEKRQL